MPYGLHSTLNLFPINVYWTSCRANICVTRLGKQKAGESSLWQRVIIMTCPFSVLLRDRGEAPLFQNKQTRKHENKVLRSSAMVEGTQRKSPERVIKQQWSPWLNSWQTFPHGAGYWVTTDRSEETAGVLWWKTWKWAFPNTADFPTAASSTV